MAFSCASVLAHAPLNADVSVQAVHDRRGEYLIAFGALSALTALYAALAYWHDIGPSEPLLSLSTFASAVLVGMWVDADSRGRTNIYRPFEYGWLVYVYWLPYVPYYLWRTRGAKGVLLFGVLLLFLLLSWLVQWVLYLAR
jgi:hypothetical protein